MRKHRAILLAIAVAILLAAVFNLGRIYGISERSKLDAARAYVGTTTTEPPLYSGSICISDTYMVPCPTCNGTGRVQQEATNGR